MVCDSAKNKLRGAWRPACLALLVALLQSGLLAAAAPAGAADTSRLALPAPVINPHSTEICMNSRISYHGGWSFGGTEQMLADVLYATSKAPVTSAYRVIYAATRDAVYIYDAGSHSLLVHKAGDWRSDATAAFEVGVAADNIFDAGTAMHLSQLESVALWTGTANQLASCPRASATTYANSHWDPADPVDIVISFGMRSVPGFTSTLVAISSDGSLPNPQTDGAVYMDSTLEHLAYATTFAPGDLSLGQVSQLLWAAYGCSNHMAGSKAGLVCSSAVANYYLTRRIYSVGAGGVYRFHDRRPPGTDLTTRDHRIELVTAGDTRPALRLAVAGLPDAPHYIVVCVGATGAWPELEVGFAAIGAVLEASTMGLQGYMDSGLSAGEQAAVRAATGIPVADYPMAVVSLGSPGVPLDVGMTEGGEGAEGGLDLSIRNTLTSGEGVSMHYALPADAAVHLTVYDCRGRVVRNLLETEQRKGSHTAVWDCRDDRGQPVLSGVYFCHLKAGRLAGGARVVVAR